MSHSEICLFGFVALQVSQVSTDSWDSWDKAEREALLKLLKAEAKVFGQKRRVHEEGKELCLNPDMTAFGFLRSLEGQHLLSVFLNKNGPEAFWSNLRVTIYAFGFPPLETTEVFFLSLRMFLNLKSVWREETLSEAPFSFCDKQSVREVISFQTEEAFSFRSPPPVAAALRQVGMIDSSVLSHFVFIAVTAPCRRCQHWWWKLLFSCRYCQSGWRRKI